MGGRARRAAAAASVDRNKRVRSAQGQRRRQDQAARSASSPQSLSVGCHAFGSYPRVTTWFVRGTGAVGGWLAGRSVCGWWFVAPHHEVVHRGDACADGRRSCERPTASPRRAAGNGRLRDRPVKEMTWRWIRQDCSSLWWGMAAARSQEHCCVTLCACVHSLYIYLCAVACALRCFVRAACVCYLCGQSRCLRHLGHGLGGLRDALVCCCGHAVVTGCVGRRHVVLDLPQALAQRGDHVDVVGHKPLMRQQVFRHVQEQLSRYSPRTLAPLPLPNPTLWLPS